jgi:hypothetical protein
MGTLDTLPEQLEVWKPVVGYEGRYEISDLGRVRSLGVRYWQESKNRWMQKKARILKPAIDQNGYPCVSLHGGKRTMRRVHLLVLEAFHGPCPDGWLSRHLDGVPTNNRLSNLLWGTWVEKMADKIAHGRSSAKLTWSDVKAIRQALKEGEMLHKLAAQYGVTKATISLIGRHQTWKEAENG